MFIVSSVKIFLCHLRKSTVRVPKSPNCYPTARSYDYGRQRDADDDADYGASGGYGGYFSFGGSSTSRGNYEEEEEGTVSPPI